MGSRTEAGKRLYRAVHEAGETWPGTAPEWDAAIAAIEDEAAALAAAEEPGLDVPECNREKWCDMPGGHRGECRSADEVLSDGG